MGFFSRKKDTPIPAPVIDPVRQEEDALFSEIQRYYLGQGLSLNAAMNQTVKTLTACKKQSKEGGMGEYSKIGEKIYEMAKTDEFLSQCLKAAEADQATREEIIDWWSASDLQRNVIMFLDEQEKMAHFIDAMDNGMSEKEAADYVKKKLPTYGYSLDIGDDNRPICPELKARVEKYRQVMTSSAQAREDLALLMEHYDTFNAIFRTGFMYEQTNSMSTKTLDPEQQDEEMIRDLLVAALMSAGCDQRFAQELAEEMLDDYKRDAKLVAHKGYAGIGEKVYELAKTDEYLARCIEIAEKDGATREEIIDWWSASDLVREALSGMDDFLWGVLYEDCFEKGMDSDEISKFIEKTRPSFGYSTDYGDKNRPICPERKKRAEEFRSAMMASDKMLEGFLLMASEYKTFNAIFRDSKMY